MEAAGGELADSEEGAVEVRVVAVVSGSDGAAAGMHTTSAVSVQQHAYKTATLSARTTYPHHLCLEMQPQVADTVPLLAAWLRCRRSRPW